MFLYFPKPIETYRNPINYRAKILEPRHHCTQQLVGSTGQGLKKLEPVGSSGGDWASECLENTVIIWLSCGYPMVIIWISYGYCGYISYA